jgi:phage terminase large subunit GpA-like protein
MTDPLAAALACVRRSLLPPPRLALSEWIEGNVRLPEGATALPGPVRLFPYQREIADAIGDPSLERVTLVKPVRVGFTTLLSAAVGHFVANDPAPVLVLQPTSADARDYVVSDLEPIFEATAVLQGVLADDDAGERNTLLSRRFAGGSLKVVAAKAPRNLRRHTARVLLVDEADAMAPGPEGSPLVLAERRTLSYADRKIVIGSTPLDAETSNVLRAYAASDRRVFEVPCAACGSFSEILWKHIEWPPERPQDAAFRCPHCAELVPELHKPAMVEAGRWRVTAPEVRGHAGFRLNALVSPLANAAWGKLAAEFLAAKDDPDLLRTFINTLLAQGWADAADEIDELALAERVEPIGLEPVPAEALYLTSGSDVQDDRIETTLIGWARDGTALVLGHSVVWGSPDEDLTWRELDRLLKTRFRHALGGSIGIDAAIVDSGYFTDYIYSFCFPRLARRVWAGKGVAGARPALQPSKGKVKSGRLFLVGVDTIKTSLLNRLARGQSVRFSDTLEPVWFEQLASERRVTRYARGQPVRRFERKPGARAEALDCVTYAFAAFAGLNKLWDAREAELRADAEPATRRPAVVRSRWLSRTAL